jgi:hypothetical protein
MSRPDRKALRKYAATMAIQRHGIELTKAMRRELLDKIHSDQYLYAEAKSGTRTMFVLRVDGKDIPVVYSRTTRDIVDVLPTHAWQIAGRA